CSDRDLGARLSRNAPVLRSEPQLRQVASQGLGLAVTILRAGEERVYRPISIVELLRGRRPIGIRISGGSIRIFASFAIASGPRSVCERLQRRHRYATSANLPQRR